MTFIRGGWPLSGGWEKLNFWQTGEWDVIIERLSDLDKKGIRWCPGRRNLFAALNSVPLDRVKVVLSGQDPYPNPDFATGLAFSIPPELEVYPPTLGMIFNELRCEYPSYEVPNGDLSPWADQGVLLWNVIPTCEVAKSKSHHWYEWRLLTAEIFNKLSDKGAVFALFGSTAHEYASYVNQEKSAVVLTSHPSPRGNMRSMTPFLGSRVFSTINCKLEANGKRGIDWRL